MEFKDVENCLESFFSKKLFCGAVFCVYQKNKLLTHKAFGINDLEKQTPMTTNKIFRAYSLTKPITVVAAFQCIERGLFKLTDPVSKFFPEFANLQVLVNRNGLEVEKNVAQVTIHHLLTMTSGLTYFGKKNRTQIETTKLLEKLTALNSKMTLADFVLELSKIPLLFQPGTGWNYGVSLDVLGAIIEKTSKLTLRDFCKQNIFDPLKMQSTDFCLLDKTREAFVYQWNFDGENNVLTKQPNFRFLLQNPNLLPVATLGGSGLFTTAEDYALFLNVLLKGESVCGQRLLKAENVELIRTDHLRELRKEFNWSLNPDYSYGYGVRVRVKNDSYPLTELGECGWDGYLGSAGIVDSKNDLVACLMLSSAQGHNKVVESEFFDAFYNDLRAKNLVK